MTGLVVVCLGLPGLASASVGSITFQGCLAQSGSSGAAGCASGFGFGAQHGLVVSPDGADVYAVGKPSGSGQVAELQRDPSTGAISEIGCFAEGAVAGCTPGGHGLIGAAGIAISPDGHSVYVASATSNAVVAFQRNPSTGALSETGCLAETASDGCTAAAGLNAATGITVSPDGASVYATSESSNAVVVFTRNTSTGALTWRGCVAESGAEGCASAPGLNHAENVVVSPDGANVYVTGFTGNSVVEFSRTAGTGDISEIGCIAQSGADGCQVGHGLSGADGIAILPDGSSLYVAAETSSAVVTLTRASASGALTEQACTAETAGDTCTLTRGLNGAARVAVSGDGQSVYAAGYHGNTLDSFSRSGTGALLAQSPCLGQSGNSDGCTAVPGLTAPAALGVSPDGRNVYTGASTSNATDSFARQQPAPAPTGPNAVPPTSMDALGDSFTQALFSGGSCSPSALCPANSWSTGTTPSVNSHYQRLLALAPALSGHAVNRSVSGKMMSYLDTEVKAAITDSPAYVTILMGLNDVCGGRLTVNTMTPTSTFRAEFQTAMNDLTSARPGASVFVASIPNPYHLWQILHTNSAATNAWTAQTVCPAMLANPTSMASADVSRRAAVLQRTVDDNLQLQQVCAEFSHCRFDGNAVFNWAFAPYDLDTGDYFHPSLQGQTDLATVTYANGFDFTTAAASPTVSTDPATALSQSGATLNGSVDPNSAATTFDFQYGTATTYGSTTPTQAAGSDNVAHNESATIGGLSPGTLYHFRLVASNSVGTTYGADRTFSTPSSQDPYAQAVLGDGPVAYWRLDESSGTTAGDQAGANPGTYTGGHTLNVPGAITGDAAAAFDGSSGYVSVPDSPSLHTGDAFTLEAWIKPAKTGAVLGIFDKSSYMLLLNANKLELYQNKVGVVATSTASITDTTRWHHVVATKSGAGVHLYIDGVDVTGTVSQHTIANSTAPLVIGAGAAYFNGAIDEAAIYNYALSAAQVSNHFAKAAAGPSASTNAATAIGDNAATLNATVNPNGIDTTYHFEYGTDTTYGHTTSTADAGSGSSSTPESSSLTGLSPATTYHFRIVATNTTGTTLGSDLTFKTTGTAGQQAPTATTLAASGVSQTGATLNGKLNPEGQDTTYYFEYGTGLAYGQQTGTQDAGSGTADVAVLAALTGLTPGTTYHYQLVATNATATTRGGDQTVTTSAPASSYAQTVLSDTPVSYWRLGEPSGTAAADVQGSHPGTYAGGYTLGAPGAIAADPNTAVALNGTTGYVSVPYSAALNPAGTWSAEAWVDSPAFSTSDDMSVITSRIPSASGHRGYELGLQQTTGKPYITIGTGTSYVTVVGPTAVALNSWTHLVATYDGSQIRLYANGALVAGPTAVVYSANTATPLNLGSIANGAGQFFTGEIDEAAVYNTTLSATAVQSHYHAGGGQ